MLQHDADVEKRHFEHENRVRLEDALEDQHNRLEQISADKEQLEHKLNWMSSRMGSEERAYRHTLPSSLSGSLMVAASLPHAMPLSHYLAH